VREVREVGGLVGRGEAWREVGVVGVTWEVREVGGLVGRGEAWREVGVVVGFWVVVGLVEAAWGQVAVIWMELLEAVPWRVVAVAWLVASSA
jgi:hypothetical protein